MPKTLVLKATALKTTVLKTIVLKATVLKTIVLKATVLKTIVLKTIVLKTTVFKTTASLFVLLHLYSTHNHVVANERAIEHVDVVGTRMPLYNVRDVNAAALGMKDPLSLPISIQSFSEQLILNQRLRTLSEVLANDASVQNTAIGTVFDFVSLRGFQLDWNNGLRRNGLALAPYQDVALENIQRIDVLKGPSGLLFGFNNPGGTINYVTKRPTRDTFIELSVEGRSRDGKYLHLDSGGRLSGQFLPEQWEMGYRINIAVEDNGDFIGGDDFEREFFSAAFDWQPNERLLLRLDVDYQDKSIVSQPLIGLARNPNNPDQWELPPYVDTSDVLLGQPWARYETETINVGLRVDYSLTDDWRVVTQTSYSENDRFTIFPDIYEVNRRGDVISSSILVTPDESYETWSGHSFVSGRFATGNIEHDMVIGLSYRKLESLDGRWFDLPNPVGNIFNPISTPKPVFPDIPDGTVGDTEEKAYFITDVVHFNDRFYTTLGLRHLEYRKDQRPPGEVTSTLYDENFTTPTVGFNYNPNERIALYISYSEGVGEGGVAVVGSGAINEGQTLAPQESEQVEVGVKYRNNTITYSAAIFEIEKMLEYHNRISNMFVQDGEQLHRGVEFNVNGELGSDLQLVASATFMDAELKNLSGEPSINGNRPANVPKSQANVFLDYALPWVSGLYINAGAFYVGERAQNVRNSLYLPSYTRFDAGLRSELPRYDITLRVKVENVFDKEYWASAGAKGIDWGVVPGRGRTVIASATVAF